MLGLSVFIGIGGGTGGTDVLLIGAGIVFTVVLCKSLPSGMAFRAFIGSGLVIFSEDKTLSTIFLAVSICESLEAGAVSFTDV